MTKTLSPFFSGAAEDEAIAIGTTASISPSPSAVTTLDVRLCIDFLIISIVLSTCGCKDAHGQKREKSLRSAGHLLNQSTPSTTGSVELAVRSAGRNSPRRAGERYTE